MRQIWCEYAVIDQAVRSAVTVTCDEATIIAVTVNTAPPDDAERLFGLTMPGFANAHSHAFHRALRGRTHGGAGDFWTWREQMYALAEVLNPDNYRALATAVFAEMLLAGMTCVGEFHYVHHGPDGQPYRDPNAMGQAIIEAAHDSGIRLTLLDTCYLQGGFNQDLTPTQRRFSDETAQQWAQRVELLAPSEQINIGVAIHSVRAVPDEALGVVAGFARERSMPLHAHVSEQPGENAQTIAAYGRTPTMWLADHGALDERFSAIHATHLDDTDIATLGDAACAVGLCPTTERDLADGIGPSPQLSAAGARLCIGSDSHAVIDPFEELRAIELNQRLIGLRRGYHSPHELLAIGTINGYRSLGWRGGEIAVGMLADLCTIKLDSVRLAGADHSDLVAAAIYAGAPADVHAVIVGGKTVVRDGQHLSMRVSHELNAAINDVWAIS